MPLNFHNARIIAAGANPNVYHAPQAVPRGDPAYTMSCSQLGIFAACPSRFIEGYVSPETKAKKWGSMIDTAILTPGQFEQKYVLHPQTYINSKGHEVPWTNRSATCREWAKDRKEEGIEVITPDDIAEIERVLARLNGEEIIKQFLADSQRQVWVEANWVSENGWIVPFKCLLDLVPHVESEFSESIGDLKSTRCAGTRVWSKFCATMNYHIQAACFIDAYNAATGEKRENSCFLLVENFAPFEPARKLLSQDDLATGRAEAERLLHNYSVCVQTRKWPSYDQEGENAGGWGLIRFDKWVRERSMMAPRYSVKEGGAFDPGYAPSGYTGGGWGGPTDGDFSEPDPEPNTEAPPEDWIP